MRLRIKIANFEAKSSINFKGGCGSSVPFLFVDSDNHSLPGGIEVGGKARKSL